jgi:hypothetical protein
MEQLHNLDTFTKILTDKGYDGYFLTQGAYPGKLKESISAYLENCHSGVESNSNPMMLLTGYLQWIGDDKPNVQCYLWIEHQSGTFDLQKMEIAKNDRFGELLKHSEITDLSVTMLPKASEAISMVSDAPKQKIVHSGKRFRF